MQLRCPQRPPLRNWGGGTDRKGDDDTTLSHAFFVWFFFFAGKAALSQQRHYERGGHTRGGQHCPRRVAEVTPHPWLFWFWFFLQGEMRCPP